MVRYFLLYFLFASTIAVGQKTKEKRSDSTTVNYFKSESYKLHSGATVYGWHPYWIEEGYKYYPYSLLSTIAFFAYDVNEKDGSCDDMDAIRAWRSTALIDSARKNKIKVLLTVTSYGKEKNSVFLKNTKSTIRLADSLLVLLRQRDAQGIDIDFSEVSKKEKSDFVKFIATLRSRLGDKCIITLHLTYKDLLQDVFDLKKLKPMVTTFIVQGFTNDVDSTSDYSIAPLYSKVKEGNCIARSIELCLEMGLQPKDLVLVLPLYGRLRTEEGLHELPYEDIVSLYGRNQISTLDTLSGSATINLNGNRDTILYYESSESISKKFRWAKEKKLGGVGLWGLGYDGGRPEVWEGVVVNYGVSISESSSPAIVKNDKSYLLLIVFIGFIVGGIVVYLVVKFN